MSVASTLRAPDAAAEGAGSLNPAPGGGRQVRRDALIYGFGIVMRRAAALIMLPVYTRLLTPSDYGLLQMLDMTLDIASILMSAGMTAGVMRFYFKATTERERHEVVFTAAALVLGLNLLGGGLLALGAAPIHQHVLDGAGERYFIYIAAANFALNETLTLPMLLMQVEGRAALFSLTSLARLVCQLSLNILFLVVFRMGPLGILMSTLITNVLLGGVAMTWLVRRVGLRGSRAALHDLRRFGVPYQLATLATFVLQFGDRFFLEASRGLAAVGIYGFAYQFGFLLDQLGTGPYMRAWQPRRFAAAHATREVRERADDAGLHTLAVSVLTVALAMTLFARSGLALVIGPAFRPASNLVPIICAAFVIQAWGGVVQFGIEAAEKTKYTTYATWISAGTVIVLYAILIPPFGAMGAAFATLTSFALRTVLLNRFSQKVWPQRYAYGAPARCAALAVGVAVLAWSVNFTNVLVELAYTALLFLLYAAGVWEYAIARGARDELKGRIVGSIAAARRRMVAA